MRRNVLFLIADDMRPDIGAYGHTRAHTPHLDRLAAEGVVFRDAHANVANCAPSRVSFLTGLRPSTHRVLGLRSHFRDRAELKKVMTLPQRFRQAGYLAISYGKVYHQFLDDAASWSTQEVRAVSQCWVPAVAASE